jgi:hypothetical protein
MTLAGRALAGAQTPDPLQELERRITELRATVDQVKKQVAVSSEMDKVSSQLEEWKMTELIFATVVIAHTTASASIPTPTATTAPEKGD